MDYSKAGQEPLINELIEDPIVKLLMKSDGVSLGALLPLIEGVMDKTYSTDFLRLDKAV